MIKVGDLVRPKFRVHIYMDDGSLHPVVPEDVCLVVNLIEGELEWVDVWVFRLAGTARGFPNPGRRFEKVAP